MVAGKVQGSRTPGICLCNLWADRCVVPRARKPRSRHATFCIFDWKREHVSCRQRVFTPSAPRVRATRDYALTRSTYSERVPANRMKITWLLRVFFSQKSLVGRVQQVYHDLWCVILYVRTRWFRDVRRRIQLCARFELQFYTLYWSVKRHESVVAADTESGFHVGITSFQPTLLSLPSLDEFSSVLPSITYRSLRDDYGIVRTNRDVFVFENNDKNVFIFF